MGKGGDDCKNQAAGMSSLLEPSAKASDLKDYFRPDAVDPEARRCLLWSAKGMSFADIAVKVGIDEVQVKKHVRKMKKIGNGEYCEAINNLPENRPAWVDGAAREYWLEGKSLRDIARGLGLNKETVRRALIKAKVARRAPADAAPTVSIFDPNSPSNKKTLKAARDAQRRKAKAGDRVGARIHEDQVDLLSGRREAHSYVQEGPFADQGLLDLMAAELVKKQNVLKGPVSKFDWEHLTADIYNEYYDEAYVMEDDSNPGRDVEVRIGKRTFGISNKSEVHAKVSDDNTSFRVSHFMYYSDYQNFGDKVKEHLADYDYSLNLRVFESTSPTTGESAMCYRVYKMPTTILQELTKHKWVGDGTHYFTAPSPPYPKNQEIKLRKQGNRVSLTSVPLALAELQAAFWVPLPPGRGAKS